MMSLAWLKAVGVGAFVGCGASKVAKTIKSTKRVAVQTGESVKAATEISNVKIEPLTESHGATCNGVTFYTQRGMKKSLLPAK